MQRVRVAILDFDNTLWESMGAVERSVGEMIVAIAERTHADPTEVTHGFYEVLLDESVADFPDCIPRHPTLKRLFPEHDDAALDFLFDDIKQEFHAAMDRRLVPYEGVEELLEKLSGDGVRVVSFSESKLPTLAHRTKRLGFDGKLEALYAPPLEFSPAEEGVPVTCVPQDCGLERTVTKALYHCGWPKSSPAALKAIIADLDADPSETVMVGDHIVRDVKTAQDAGCIGAYARYGRETINELEVSSQAHPYIARAVKSHADLQKSEIRPDISLNSPAQLLQFVFGPGPAAEQKLDLAQRAEVAAGPSAMQQLGLGGGRGRRGRGGRGRK